MNMIEVNRLLTLIAAGDGRKVDDATVSFWAGLVGDLHFDECVEAVRRHYLKSTTRLMPAHVRELVLAIREERRPRHEVLALPSVFEQDVERDARLTRGLALCSEVLRPVRERLAAQRQTDQRQPEDPIRQRALERARLERKGRKA